MKRIACAAILFVLAAFPATATSTKYFTSASQDLWEGRPFGLVVHKDGTFAPGPDWAEAEKLGSTPISSLSVGEATYIGTTSPAEIIVIRGGKAEKLCSFEETIVTSIASGGGRIYAGTASPARVYEIDGSGGKKLVAQLEGETVGCLIVAGSGALLAGTSSPAGLYEIIPGGTPRKIASLSASYARCILKADNAVYIGTSDPALLYAIDSSDKLSLLDSFEEDELAGMAPAAGGLMLILNPKKEKGKEGAQSRCVLYSAASGTTTVSKLGGPLVSLRGKAGKYFIASSDGRIYRVEDGKIGFSRKFESQPSQLFGEGNSPCVAFSSPPGFSIPLRSGLSYYESPVINAGGLSKAGPLKTGVSGQAEVLLRAGNREKPDDSWSGWLSGPDFSSLKPSRFFQWKYQARGAGDDLRGVVVALRPLNRPPVIDEAKVHPPCEIFVKGVSQLGDRLVQDVHDKERPFPEIALSRPVEAGTQDYYLYGFRMVSYTAADPDGDELRFKVELLPYGSGKAVTLGENIKENFFAFDARMVPDGLYRVVVTATDSTANQAGEAMTGDRVLPYFEIDNTPPAVEIAESAPGTLRFRVSDGTGINAARVSRDGQKWDIVESDSGSFAQRGDTYTVKIMPSDDWIVFQAADNYGNVSTKGWIRKN
jgi:hypothetical protein